MDWQRWRISVAVAWLRVRTLVKSVLRLTIAAVLLVAVFNLFVAYLPVEGLTAIELYPRTQVVQTGQHPPQYIALEDLAIFVGGMIVAWWL